MTTRTGVSSTAMDHPDDPIPTEADITLSAPSTPTAYSAEPWVEQQPRASWWRPAGLAALILTSAAVFNDYQGLNR